MTIRDISPADFATVLSLNAQSVDALSPLDLPRLTGLHGLAAYHRGIQRDGQVVAFLLAFRQGVNYDSPNYRWFSTHRDTFLYVDRIVVRSDQRRQNCGTRLYHDIISFAERERCGRVVCEFNVVPLNEASRSFHERFGFREVGTQWLNEGAKKVSLQELCL